MPILEKPCEYECMSVQKGGAEFTLVSLFPWAEPTQAVAQAGKVCVDEAAQC